jgi:hypothetical protein
VVVTKDVTKNSTLHFSASAKAFGALSEGFYFVGPKSLTVRERARNLHSEADGPVAADTNSEVKFR